MTPYTLLISPLLVAVAVAVVQKVIVVVEVKGHQTHPPPI